MRITLITATSVAILLAALAFTSLHAQPPGAGAPRGSSAAANPTGVAVIDITYILENYNRLKQDKETFNRDMQLAQDELKKERDVIARKAEQMKAFKAGSPEYKKAEEEVTKAGSDLKLKAASKERDFAERESKTYLAAYQEIQRIVKAHADRNGISLVLRFSGNPIDPNNPQQVQMEVFKMVMHYNKDIDITPIILNELNGRAQGIAAPPSQRGPGKPSAPR